MLRRPPTAITLRPFEIEELKAQREQVMADAQKTTGQDSRADGDMSGHATHREHAQGDDLARDADVFDDSRAGELQHARAHSGNGDAAGRGTTTASAGEHAADAAQRARSTQTVAQRMGMS